MGGSLTRYFPGGAQTLVSERNLPVPQLAMPSIGGGAAGGLGLPDFSGILARRQAIEAEREARAAALQSLQMRAMSQRMGQEDADFRVGQNERFTASMDAAREARNRSAVQDVQ